MPFPCTKCGLCCKNVDKNEVSRHLDRGDGTCKNFDDATHLCRIYETRPLFCRVDAMHTLTRAVRDGGRGPNRESNRELWYYEVAKVCDALCVEAGIPEQSPILRM